MASDMGPSGTSIDIQKRKGAEEMKDFSGARMLSMREVVLAKECARNQGDQ